MVAVICLFLPAFAMNLLRGKLIVPNRGMKREILEYLMSVLMVNYAMMSVLTVFGEHKENIVAQMNQYLVFSWKYLSCALIISVAEVFLEKFIRQKLEISVTLCNLRLRFKYWKAAIWVYSFVLFCLNAIRIFDHNFWGDEAYSVIISRRNLLDLLEITAQSDSHPPLYYLICKFVCDIAGTSGIVYHLISMIPYVIILILSLTVVCKWFGFHATLILVTLASLLPNAVTYNVEVRMYSWGEMFIFLSFLALYKILKEGTWKDYVLFIVATLAAAYTHYYCLVAVAILYLILLCDAIVYKTKKKIIYIAVTYLCAVVGYLPWLGFLIMGIQRHINGFWATEIPSVKTCMDYIFNTKYGYILLFLLFFTAAAAILYESGILHTEKAKKIKISFHLKKACITVKCQWIISGFICMFGTMMVGMVVSVLFRPLLVLRYIYPVLIIAWLILGVCISSLKWKSVYTAFVVILMVFSAVPEYRDTFLSEKEANESLNETLIATQNLVGQNDVILTNNLFIYGSVSECYYPGIECQKLDAEFEMNSRQSYWLIADGNLTSLLMEQGIDVEDGFEIITSGNLGMIPVWIYQITDTKQAEHILKDMMSTG